MGCSSEYKTVLRHPEFRKRFHRLILEGPVRKRVLHVRFVNGRSARKYTSRFGLPTSHFWRAALANFIQQTIKNGL